LNKVVQRRFLRIVLCGILLIFIIEIVLIQWKLVRRGTRFTTLAVARMQQFFSAAASPNQFGGSQ
jgi:hypothetical protein